MKQEGFKDIEDRKTGMLRSWAGTTSLGHVRDGIFGVRFGGSGSRAYSSLERKESQAEYYRVAAQCLHEAEFKDLKKKMIWQLHSEGFSFREIAKELSSTVNKVRRAVENMAIEFGLSFIVRKKGKKRIKE